MVLVNVNSHYLDNYFPAPKTLTNLSLSTLPTRSQRARFTKLQISIIYDVIAGVIHQW